MINKTFIKVALKAMAPWAVALAAVIACVATYTALTQTSPIGNDPKTVLIVLNLDLLVLLSLGILIARRVLAVHKGSRQAKPGAGLQVRLIYTFSMIAAVPVVIMTLFSALFFHFGVQTWLSTSVQDAINGSRAVAQAYLNEHRQVIKSDMLAMANDLNRQSDVLANNSKAFESVVRTQSFVRGLSEALVVDANGDVFAQGGLSIASDIGTIPQLWLEEANTGGVVLLPTKGDDKVRALVKLDAYKNRYLLVGRSIDKEVLSHVDATRAAADDYVQLQTHYSGLRITITLIYVVVGLLMLLAAIWFGILFARRLGAPISTLIAAANSVRAGDLSVRVEEKFKFAELGQLAQAFNRMTGQIGRAQEELRAANRTMNERRRFTETVLSGVSSGVLSLDEQGVINVINAAASRMLARDSNDLLGVNIKDIMPQIADIIKGDDANELDSSISLYGRRFLVRVAKAQGGGSVITFDDVTALESAQRQAAWADVARRVAHEIKNPLTPIQLSAERLKRRYADQITQGKDVFAQCIDTIVRHVGDIGRMVDEFSSFARMPAPVMANCAIAPIVRQVVSLQKPVNPNVEFTLNNDNDDIICKCDARQIRQAITNLLQNAAEAVDAKDGKIDISINLEDGGGKAVIVIADNGDGLPEGDLKQPYVTHKEGGTGLGLAIVSKIAEDHDGKLELKPNPSGKGAVVSLSLPAAAIMATATAN